MCGCEFKQKCASMELTMCRVNEATAKVYVRVFVHNIIASTIKAVTHRRNRLLNTLSKKKKLSSLI